MEAKNQNGKKIVYAKVWELPVRIAHWLIFLSVVILGITGYLIGNPSFSEPTEASKAYTFGTIRSIHFIAAYVLLSAFLIRLYWGFAGNYFSRWRTMLPVTNARWRGIFSETKDLVLPRGVLRVYTGHSPMANIGYLTIYTGIAFSIVSGFTLHAASHYTPFWRKVAQWGLALFGNNLNTVHLLHHLVMWFFAVFILIHLYLVIYTVVVSRTTEIDTMFSGSKFVFEEELAADHEG
jgi:Ni/Fe-hydrogenase 1 B-type cytochrome subunit